MKIRGSCNEKARLLLSHQGERKTYQHEFVLLSCLLSFPPTCISHFLSVFISLRGTITCARDGTFLTLRGRGAEIAKELSRMLNSLLSKKPI